MGNYAERGRTPPHAIMRDDPPPIVLIKEEHQIFRELFDRVESAEGDALIDLSGEIGARLVIHMKIEEEILYPALKEVINVEEVDEGIVEHQVARKLMLEANHRSASLRVEHHERTGVSANPGCDPVLVLLLL